jgi:hypothetical protein
VHGLPTRFVVRFTALPASGAWEAALIAQTHEAAAQPVACGTGATPADAIAALLAQPAPQPERLTPELATAPRR